jgi:hypothetical protein
LPSVVGAAAVGDYELSQEFISAPLATLIASLVAALGVVVTLVFTLLNKKGEEYRKAHRDVIADDLKLVGKAIHEVLALANIQLKVISSPQHPERYKAAADAAKRLKERRLDVRYSLWGLDEGFRTLTRLPDWIGHAKPEPDIAAKLFARGKALGMQMDLAVRDAYVNGRVPSKWRSFRVNREATNLKAVYNTFAASRKLPLANN